VHYANCKKASTWVGKSPKAAANYMTVQAFVDTIVNDGASIIFSEDFNNGHQFDSVEVLNSFLDS
jgi:predicted nucleic acid-binding protein